MVCKVTLSTQLEYEAWEGRGRPTIASHTSLYKEPEARPWSSEAILSVEE